jgi:two-component system sensor histidine kinase BarA
LSAQVFLYKPISIQKLQDAIEVLINQEQIEKSSHPGLESLREQLRFLHPSLLIAEDNPVNKMLLDSLLGTHTEIISVNDGEMAVTACENKKYSLILLDLQMPKLNGLEAARLIRQKSRLNRLTPIILISANGNEVNHFELKKAGVDFCLHKPIDEKQLLIHILRIAEKAKHMAIDWELCVQKVSGNQALAEEFLDQFVQELYKNREELIQLMHDKKIKQLKEVAHKLHGACCFCGVPTLQKKVVHLEKLAECSTSIEALASPFAELIQSIDAVISDYENHKINSSEDTTLSPTTSPNPNEQSE